MWSSPEGYGSISSTYVLAARPAADGASGFGTWNACSSSQTRCHFCSICCGSYGSIVLRVRKRPPQRPKGKRRGCSPRCLPVLRKELLHRAEAYQPRARHATRDRWQSPPVLDLFPETARIDDGELVLGGVA